MSESDSVGELTGKMYIYTEEIDRKYNWPTMGRVQMLLSRALRVALA